MKIAPFGMKLFVMAMVSQTGAGGKGTQKRQKSFCNIWKKSGDPFVM